MYLSKAQITRLLLIAIIVIAGWSIWKRLDAVIDNYKQYYDTALGVQIIQNMWEQMSNDFDRKFDMEWDNFDRKFGQKHGEQNVPNSNNNQEMEQKWEKYEKNAPLKPHNKPVPMIADEWTKGYYTGFWNFFIRSGLASIFAIVIVVVSGGFLIRLVFKKLSDEKINNSLKKIGLG